MNIKKYDGTKKAGFTLAELLVVVAIIAILVAVSIPVFSGKLDKAREATDLANIRAAKAAAVTYYLTDDMTVNGDWCQGYYDAENGNLSPGKADIKGYNKAKVKNYINDSTLDADEGVIFISIHKTQPELFEVHWVPKG